MPLFVRSKSPYWWKRYPIDPLTGIPILPRASTRIPVDAPTKEQRAANKLAAEIQYHDDLNNHRLGIAGVVKVKAPTWATYEAFIRQYYIAHHTNHHRGKSNELNTLDRLVRHFGKLPCEGVTTEVVDAYRHIRLETVKVSTVHREMQILMVSLRRMATLLKKAGCSAPDPKELLADLPKLRVAETETRWFSQDEFDAFIGAIAARGSILGTPRLEGLALAKTAVETCLRMGSLLRLRQHNYRGTHLVPLDAKQEIKRSPVSPTTRPYYDAMEKLNDHLFGSHFRAVEKAMRRGLLLTERRQLQSAAAHMDRWFREVCRLAELPCGREAHGLTFHSFRHTGATWLLEGAADRRPVSVKTVMELGGWHNVKLFMKTYCHTDAKSVDAAAASLFPNGLPGLPVLVEAESAAS
jgi:integrase